MQITSTQARILPAPTPALIAKDGEKRRRQSLGPEILGEGFSALG